MRALVLVFSLATGGGDHWFGGDKVKHFFVSAFVQSVGYGVLRTAGVKHDGALIGASAITLGVGIGKEVYDSHTGEGFSARDLTWDVAGAGAATLVLAHAR